MASRRKARKGAHRPAANESARAAGPERTAVWLRAALVVLAGVVLALAAGTVARNREYASNVKGNADEAVVELRRAVELNPADARERGELEAVLWAGTGSTR